VLRLQILSTRDPLERFGSFLERVQVLGRFAHEESALQRADHHATHGIAVHVFIELPVDFRLVVQSAQHVCPQVEKPVSGSCKVLIGITHLLGDVSEKSACLATAGYVEAHDPINHEFDFLQGVGLVGHERFKER
jgi:hypothetical protein